MKIEAIKKFSLIELLCVTVIAILLMAMSIPSFFNILKGQDVQLAARGIGSKLKAIRGYAISQRCYTAMVFITTQTIMNDPQYCYKSYRACIVNFDNSFQSWMPDEKWEFLPVGTIIRSLDISRKAEVGTFPKSISKPNIVTSVIDTNLFSSPSCLPALIFKPTGEIVGNRIYLTIGEGFFKKGSPLPLTVKNLSDSSVITIDNHTGKILYENL